MILDEIPDPAWKLLFTTLSAFSFNIIVKKTTFAL
jgi:hypothetical protein